MCTQYFRSACKLKDDYDKSLLYSSLDTQMLEKEAKKLQEITVGTYLSQKCKERSGYSLAL